MKLSDTHVFPTFQLENQEQYVKGKRISTYSRLQNKHRGTFINFEKKLKGKKMKNDRNVMFNVKMNFKSLSC